jgi:FAD dependent oxidoreductase
MNRRRFLKGCTSGLTALCTASPCGHAVRAGSSRPPREVAADLVIVGGGLGGCATALAALENNLRVVLTEPTDWIGGQLTVQAVPSDEHRWGEQFGRNARYQKLRQGIRDHYRRHFPLTAEAQAEAFLNPGRGSVSRLCHEPRVALAVLTAMLAPHASGGRLLVLLEHEPIAAEVEGAE